MTKWVVEWQSCFHKEGEWSQEVFDNERQAEKQFDYLLSDEMIVDVDMFEFDENE